MIRRLISLGMLFLSAATAIASAPAAPTRVATTASGSLATLNWTAATAGDAATSFRIEAGSRVGLTDLASFNTDDAATGYSRAGVPAGTYYLRVRGVNASGTGNPSEDVQLIVPPTGCSAAPTTPHGLTTVLNDSGAVSLVWTGASGAPTSYRLEAGSTAGQANLANVDLGSSATHFSANAVADGTYFVRVRASNACGTSAASDEIVVKVDAAASTGQPRWNAACSTQGQFAVMGLFAICDRGVWRYATYADAPQVPPAGTPTRPNWYPTLADILGSKMVCPTAGVQFSTSPLPLRSLAPFAPYGTMVYDHVTPIDHAYLNIVSLDKPPAARTESDYVPVTSPGSGVIIELSSLGSPTSNRVVVDHGCGIYTVYMVVNRVTGVLAPYAQRVANGESLRLAIPVVAGTEFGRQRDNPLDFNVFDQQAWLPGLVNVFSYSAEAFKPYLADPTPYFTPTLASYFQTLSRRTQTPRWGKIDNDLMGTAQGNWFLDGTLGYACVQEADAAHATAEIRGGPLPGKNSYSYCHLSLSPHWLQPDTPIASIGWWSNPAGDFQQLAIRLKGGQPAPAQVSSATGAVVYELVPMTFDGSPADSNTPSKGLLAIQVNADTSLTVETLPGATSSSAFAGFSANQRRYHR